MYNCDLNWYTDGTDKQLACHRELKNKLFELVCRWPSLEAGKHATAECPAYSNGREGACRIKDCMNCSICQTINWLVTGSFALGNAQEPTADIKRSCKSAGPLPPGQLYFLCTFHDLA